MKVCMVPSPGADGAVGGIQRVVQAMHRYLPDLGVEFTDHPANADLLVAHAIIPPNWPDLYPRTPIVALNHGLYWAEYEWDAWAKRVNNECMELMRIADRIVAVSDWVAQAIRRATCRPVTVIGHGVDLEDWAGEDGHDGYVLWDKSRPDPVCDPSVVDLLAHAMPDTRFVSTFGTPAPNVILTGEVPYPEARQLTRRAGVYLATTRETFGISTLQALAAGVPVVGWAWGGQVEILAQQAGELPAGILVRPGDFPALKAAIARVLGDREPYSLGARQLAERFTWAEPIAAYARVFGEAVARATAKGPRTSIIVPAYNLARYLPQTLDSVAAQTDRDWECIIVDDHSPDETAQIARAYARKDRRFKVVINAENVYLAEARNIGIRKARGRYILPLDADDQLAPGAVQTLADALDRKRHIAIAYGNVRFVLDDGVTPAQVGDPAVRPPGYSGWPHAYSHHDQMRARGQQMPYASMYRRTVWEWTGGYRRRWSSSEDCDFWTRAVEYGHRPEYVTEADTLIYRIRSDSMSQTKGWRDVEVKRWFPGSRDTGHSPAGSVQLDLPVPSCDPPVVAIVIPVGPGHERYVIDALDSVAAQTFGQWEAIVVNDSGAPLGGLPSWARVIDERGLPGALGPARARNLGIAASRAGTFIPLDADDLLEPQAVELMLRAFAEADGATIYTDWWADSDPASEAFLRHEAQDFDARLLTRGSMHPVTALYPRVIWEKVGGFDEALTHWEDWDFQFRTAAIGHCERRLAVALWTYRMRIGSRREANVAAFDAGKAQIETRWGKYWRGEQLMACGCKGATIRSAGGGTTPAQAKASAAMGDAALVTYTGKQTGVFTFTGPVSGRRYRFERGVAMYVLSADVPGMVARGDFAATATAIVPAVEELDTPQLVPA